MMFARTALFTTVGALSLATSEGAAAQKKVVFGAEEIAADGEAIVVTARKRAESVMNVPVVATTLGQEQLERFATADLRSLATMVPGLSLGSSILSVGLQASLRGVGTTAIDPGVDASVALNIDGMSLSQGLAYSSGMFDVAGIEVLKGPQALFYGKGSPGGVIALRTADPSDEFELIARVAYEFEARERRAEAIVSGPLSDAFKVRVAAAVGKQDGFFRNTATGNPLLGGAGPSSRRLGPAKDYKLRGTILVTPSSSFDARIKFNRAVDDTNYAGTNHNVFCPDGVGPVGGRQYLDPNDNCKLDRDVSLVDLSPAAFPGVPNGGVPYNKTKQTYGTAELNLHIQPDLTLTSHTGYYLANSSSLLNAAVTASAAGLFNATNRFQRRQFTEELRLSSDFSTPLNFTIGAFIERSRFYNIARIGGNTTLGAAPALQRGRKTVDIETESLFGQVLYDALTELEIALGARWTNERRRQVGVNLISGTAVPVALAVPQIGARNIAPELSLTYRPSDDLTLFASLKQAYKSGSFNVATPPVAGENNSFNDERVRGVEAGVKLRTANRSLFFNIAGFYYKYQGLQVGANVQSTGGVSATRTVNAGAARSYGVEADVRYSPDSIAGLTLRAAAVWLDAKYTRLLNVPCYGGQTITQGCNLLFSPTANGGTGGFTSQDRSGVPLVRAPKISSTFGVDYEIPISDDWNLILASNNQYQTRSLVNLGFLYYQRAYLKTDASLTLKSASDQWELALIGKNLNNEITAGNCTNNNRGGGAVSGIITGTNDRGIAGSDEVGCFADRGRELWVRATLRY